MLTLPNYKIGSQIDESVNSLVYRGLIKKDNQPVILSPMWPFCINAWLTPSTLLLKGTTQERLSAEAPIFRHFVPTNFFTKPTDKVGNKRTLPTLLSLMSNLFFILITNG